VKYYIKFAKASIVFNQLDTKLNLKSTVLTFVEVILPEVSSTFIE